MSGFISALVFLIAVGGQTSGVYQPEDEHLPPEQAWDQSQRDLLHGPVRDTYGERQAVAAAIRKASAPTTEDPKFAEAIMDGGEAVVVSFEGEYCELCAAKINNALSKRGAVAASAVDLDKKTVTIALQPGEKLDDARIARIVARAGFEIADIRRGAKILHAAEKPDEVEKPGDGAPPPASDDL